MKIKKRWKVAIGLFWLEFVGLCVSVLIHQCAGNYNLMHGFSLDGHSIPAEISDELSILCCSSGNAI